MRGRAASAICLHFEPVGVWARERRFVLKPISNVDPSSKADVVAGIFRNLPLRESGQARVW
jgi:hypothetical protein